jgi:spore maturation protein CgeB
MRSPKVLLTGSKWFGDLLAFCERGLLELGAEVRAVATNQFEWMENAKRWRQRLVALPLVGSHLDWKLSQSHRRRLIAGANRRILEAINDWRPDVLLSILCWGEPITDELFDQMPKKSLPIKIAWLMDDPFQHDGSLAGIAPCYDLVYVVDGSWIEPIQLFTGRAAVELPCGADLQAYHPVAAEALASDWRCGVVFVGSSYRGHIVGKLRNSLLKQVTDLKLHIYGDEGWRCDELPSAGGFELAACYRGGELSSEEANLAYNGADIALNIHHPQFRMGTSLRTFAISAAGAFQLVDWRPGLDRFFVLDEEIVTYRTPEDLREKATYYLANEVARRRIARAGYERVRREHTYARRLAQMLRDVELTPGNRSPSLAIVGRGVKAE